MKNWKTMPHYHRSHEFICRFEMSEVSENQQRA